MIPSQTQPPGFFVLHKRCHFHCHVCALPNTIQHSNETKIRVLELNQINTCWQGTAHGVNPPHGTKILKDNFYWDVAIASETMPNASDIGTPWAQSLDDALYKACWNTPLPYRSSSLRAGFSRTSFKAFGAWGSTRRSHGLHGWGGVCNWLNTKPQIWINLKTKLKVGILSPEQLQDFDLLDDAEQHRPPQLVPGLGVPSGESHHYHLAKGLNEENKQFNDLSVKELIRHWPTHVK